MVASKDNRRHQHGTRARSAPLRALDHPTTRVTVSARLRELVEQAAAVCDVDAYIDVYGTGIVADLERRVAEVLGVDDAAFFPSGTMAQQVALRCWAQRSSLPTVGMHSLAHPQLHESDALFRVSGLLPVTVANSPRPITAAEVRSVAEPLGTLMLELPLREAGFVLPSWEELVEVVTAAREGNMAVHFDGARLWECATHFGKSLDQVVALADSVYVSFYKSLRGLSGAALAGSSEFIKQARLWRHRFGGNLFQQFPAAVSALDGLRRELPRLPQYVAQARVVAEALHEELSSTMAGWSAVHPRVPHTHQFQVWLPHSAAVLTEAANRQMDSRGVALFAGRWREPGLPPGVALTEVTIGEPGLEWSRAEVRDALREFLAIVSV